MNYTDISRNIFDKKTKYYRDSVTLLCCTSAILCASRVHYSRVRAATCTLDASCAVKLDFYFTPARPGGGGLETGDLTGAYKYEYKPLDQFILINLAV